jgi:hypothetical protein
MLEDGLEARQAAGAHCEVAEGVSVRVGQRLGLDDAYGRVA